MRHRRIGRAVSIWLATLAVGALALMAALRWAPQLVSIAGGLVLLLGMLGLAALDLMLQREKADLPDEPGRVSAEANEILENELKRKDRGSLPQARLDDRCDAKAPGAPPSDQRSA